MPSGPAQRYDFFLSRRGSVAAVAIEVAAVLKENGYKLNVEDYDFRLGASFVEAMHEGIKNSRDLLILYTADYEASLYTRKEFTSFVAEMAQSTEERHIIILRCEDVPLRGLLSDIPFQDLVGVLDVQERKRRIIAAAERQSQAVPPPPRPFVGVPPRIASFTGRADELDRLDAILMQDKPAAVTQSSVGRAALQGMGGVGKSSLAIEYAHRFRGLYAGVCWCSAETRTGLLSALTSLAVTLGAATVEEADIEKAAKAALRRLAEQRATWLLVYDNVSRPEEIAELLPSAGAKVLITSRFPEWRRWAEQVALDVLPRGEAVALLEKLTLRVDATGAKTLAEALDCLPLALDHAAAYCGLTQVSFADYAATASMLIAELPSGVGYPKSVAATFKLAIAEAVTRCQSAEALVSYLAQCSPERIPMILVEGAVEEKAERLRALAALAEVSLLKHDPFEDGTPAVMVHRLVLAVAGAMCEASGLAQEAVETVIAHLFDIYPEGAFSNPQSWPLCSHLTPHLLTLWQASNRKGGTKSSAFAHLLNRAGIYFLGRALYADAAPLLRDALAIREKTLGSQHSETVESVNNLATLLMAQGDFAGARALLEHAVASSGALGLNDPQILNNLAVVLEAQGDLSGARSLFERVLAIRELALGRDHPDTAQSLNNLGRTLEAQGDLAGAGPLLERAVTISENALGPEHPNTAQCLSSLAGLCQRQGDLARAQPLYERALQIAEKMLGREHPDTLTILNDLALLLAAQGNFTAARAHYERALAIYDATLGPEHPSANMVRYNLSCLFLRLSAPSQALELGVKALSNFHNMLGPDHKSTKDSALITSAALDALRRTQEAKALREQYGLKEPEKPKIP